MPMAIPLVVGLAAQGIAATAFGIAFGTFASSVIGAIASTAASFAMGSSAPDAPDINSTLNQAGAGRTQAIRQPIAPHQIIAGRVKVSGVYIFVHTQENDGGEANGHLFMVHAYAGHEVRAFGPFYFQDNLTTDTAFGSEQVFWRITPHLGASDQAADTNLVAEIGDPYWTEDHRLRGRAYLAIKLYWSPEIWAAGIPNISSIVEGVNDIYDPRTAATGWTNNAALFIARWFTAPWGMNLAQSDLNEASVIAAANICDERVRVKTGSATAVPIPNAGSPVTYTGLFDLSDGARELDVGDGVRLTTSGTLPTPLATDVTYYVIPSTPYNVSDESVDLNSASPVGIRFATSAANAIAGIAIDITSGGSGTTTILYWDEARYKLNGQWTLDSPKGQVLEQLLTAMAGSAVLIGGQWFLHAGAAATPIVTLTVDDLRDEMQWVPKRSMRDRFNGIRAVYVNPDANWQPVDAPLLQSATYLEEDDDEELIHDARYPFTTSTRAAQRLQKIALEMNRRQGTLTFPAKLTAMRLQVWDGVYVTHERYGWDQKQFRVVGWVLTEDGGIDLTLREDDADVYAWSSSEEQDSAVQQGVVLPDPDTIAAPESIVVDTPTIPIYSRLNATIGEVKSIWRDGYDVEFRPRSFETWSSTGRIDTELISIVTSEAIDIQVRAVTRSGSPSAFAQNLAPGMPTDVAEGTPLELTWTNGDGAAEVQIFSATTTFDRAILYATVPATPASQVVDDNKFYWLRSVNAQGNVSNTTESIQIGLPGGSGEGGGDSDGGSGGDGGDGGGDE